MRKMQILVLATLAAGLFFCTNSASASAVRVAQDRLQQLTSSFDDEFEVRIMIEGTWGEGHPFDLILDQLKLHKLTCRKSICEGIS